MEIISSDMRDWKPDLKADIIVSELLGSFSCNELSPECLIGAKHLLKVINLICKCGDREVNIRLLEN